MAGRVFKAGIRFNETNFKYMFLNFNEDSSTCTVDAHVVLNDEPLILRGVITGGSWVPVNDEDAGSDPLLSAQAPTRATKTTAKKAVKESK